MYINEVCFEGLKMGYEVVWGRLFRVWSEKDREIDNIKTEWFAQEETSSGSAVGSTIHINEKLSPYMGQHEAVCTLAELLKTCPECETVRHNDERVLAGMKCSRCAYA